MADYDTFNDIRNTQTGIFGSDQASIESGLKNHDSVHSTVDERGVVFEMECQGCGVPTQIVAEWPEMVALKYGVNPAFAFRGNPGIMSSEPTKWEFLPHEQSWRPDMRCPRCDFHICLRVLPDEPEKFLSAGRRKGIIIPQGEQKVAAICHAVSNNIRQQNQARPIVPGNVVPTNR